MEPKDLVLLMMIPLLLISIIAYTDRPAITGAVTAGEQENNVIGTYSIMPSFKAKIDYDLNDYEKINEQLDSVLSCYEFTKDIESCMDEAKKGNGFEWNSGCDRGAEKVLYEFAEFYQDCFDSEDNNCLCRKNLDVSKEFIKEHELASNKEYELELSETGFAPSPKIKISLAEPAADLSYEINTNGIAGWFPSKYKISYSKEGLNSLNMIFVNRWMGETREFKDDGIIFGSGPLKDLIIYKNERDGRKYADFIKIEDNTLVYPLQSRNIEKPENLHDCAIKPKNTLKFCVTKKNSKLNAYDESDSSVKEREMVYKFAVKYTE